MVESRAIMERLVMSFVEIIIIIISFNISLLGATRTASLVIGNSAKIRTENLLIKFMIDLEQISSEKLDNHRLIVLGKNADSLQATKVLLKRGTPYFIGTKTEAMVLPPNFGANNHVLFFIDGFSDSEINSTLAKLPRDYKCKALLLSANNRTDESIAKIIKSAAELQVINVLFADFDGQVMKIYGETLNANCGLEIRLLNTWVPEVGFSSTGNVFGRKRTVNERGCPKIVSTFEMRPTMMLRKDEDESLHITGGVEGRLVQCIAEHLNTVLVVRPPALEEQFWITPDGTVSGIVADVARGVAGLGIGQIRPTLERGRLVDMTMSYNHECMVWTVPLTNEYNYDAVTSEFSPTTWIMVIFPVSLCCGLSYVIPKLKLGKPSLKIIDVIAVSLNYAIPRNPSALRCRLLFILYLHYSRIISTAYSTSLSSILTTTTVEPAIVDEEGILAAGLRTAGTQSSLALLADQISPESPRAELINRYEVMMSIGAALARIAVRRDIAYHHEYSAVSYVAKELLKAGKPIEFYPLPECVLSYNSVMVTPKGSRLTGQVNEIIQRLGEAGIYNHWQSLDHTFFPKIKTLEFNNLSLSRLRSIFLLYLHCLIPALLAFFAELIFFKLKLNCFAL